MKRAILLLLLLNTITAIAQPQLTENQKLESLAKIWGFLKYYHPEVAKGKIDWDAALFEKIDEVKKAKDIQELNTLYNSWLTQLGPVKPCRNCDNSIPDSLMRNLTFDWLYDTNTFTPDLVNKLDYIRKNRNQGKNYYVQPRYPFLKIQAYFKNEKDYPDLENFPPEEYRLLGLFRYWNSINYFFPYKYAIGENWDNVLADMVPKFREASNTGEYHLAMKELTVRINDGHSFFYTRLLGNYFGALYAPFNIKIIDDKVVVSAFYHEGFAKADNIEQGDVITKIDGQTITEVLESKLKYVAGSNYSYKLSEVERDNLLLRGNSPTFNITVMREGEERTLSIRRYPIGRFGLHLKAHSKPQPWSMLQAEIGYLEMGSLERKDVKAAMKELWDTKAIIIDLRKYPNNTSGLLSTFLLSEKYNNLMTYPDLSYPGVFRPYFPPGAYGKKNNKGYYKGKVVLLVNEGTMSTGEFSTMALQQAPHATVIGSQTAGADGNVVDIVFPGGFIAKMSGLGVYYPDGRETQRIGIVPDIEVKPTLDGVLRGEDEVLARAIQFIKTAQ